jgi:hypothetical protein
MGFNLHWEVTNRISYKNVKYQKAKNYNDSMLQILQVLLAISQLTINCTRSFTVHL